jgi:hypothetical protein
VSGFGVVFVEVSDRGPASERGKKNVEEGEGWQVLGSVRPRPCIAIKIKRV